MKLRIIAGTLKGRLINIPERDAGFRPTLERTRQSVLEIIKGYLPGAIAADVCCGSGAFGFEMISRGALRVDFFENDRRRADLLFKNSSVLGISDQCRIISGDIRTTVKRMTDFYDIIFYDPPYADIELAILTSELLNRLSQDGFLVYERAATKDSLKNASNNQCCFDIREFGDTAVEFYRLSEK
ncbi:MAG TPA: RsmD family RNA methyltransferase [Chitinispirillaceae bacterium]|nr:RsmD family RNA methyltransferase [Chitinispirillaceae bacterium]